MQCFEKPTGKLCSVGLRQLRCFSEEFGDVT